MQNTDFSRNVRSVLVLCLVLVSAPAFAQASVGAYKVLSPEKKFYFVAGYIEGFALAAQIPPDRAGLLHHCFRRLRYYEGCEHFRKDG
jgi:hypothetical protein